MPEICASERNSNLPYVLMIKRIGHFLIAYWPSLFVGAGIVYLSLFHAASLQLDVSNPDKFSHLVAYLVWTCCLTGDLWRDRVSFNRRIFWGLIFPIIFGGIIELLQAYFFPPRAGEWLDWYADFSGTVLGFVIVDVICRFFPPKTKHS